MRIRSHLALLVAAAFALLLVACAPDDQLPVTGAAAGGAAAADSAVPAGSIIEFHATEFAFAPMELTAEPGTYTGLLVNDGTIQHDITFPGQAPIVAQPGATVEFSFEVPEGGLQFHCSVPGHSEAGMVGSIRTPGSPVLAASTAPAATATDEVAADPDAPPYIWRDPTLPARGEGEGITLVPGGADDGGDLIEVEMVVEEKLMTVAEGYQQLVWTFNGTVPGPVLHARVGDTIRVHLVNPAENSSSHSVDFHASQVAWNDEMHSIAPGEDLIYEYRADYAGVWMYHCGTNPVLHHIANGMFGMVVVDPVDGLPPVDHEFFLTQSEWYLGPQGEVSSFAKANQGAPSPDFVMFNGVAFQYKDHPIEVGTGDTVRFYVLDVGPSIDSSFHIVGTIFNDVIKEGVHLAKGNDGNWGSQAVDLAPAQSAIIELSPAEDGLYPIVTHAFNFPGRGALGLLQAGDGEP